MTASDNPVGSASVEMINDRVKTLATRAHDLYTEIKAAQLELAGLGQQGLEGIGFDSKGAAKVLRGIGVMNSCQGIYFGAITQRSPMNFDLELSEWWTP